MKQTIIQLIRLSSALGCACGSLALGLHAQTAAPATTTPATSSTSPDPEHVTKLAKFTVTEVPLSEQVLPTVRPVGSVMGDDRNILDIPRSVSSINAAMKEDRLVRDAMDFGQFAPGVYSSAQYGIPSIPYIRGDLSQLYMGGQQIPFSRNSTPPSFNGAEAFDIVKGPGSAVYGPQTEGAGGYVNFVMKQPYFDRQHTTIDATYSGWSSGHSYSNPEFTFDTSGPLSDKLAYRVSYFSRYGTGYYANQHNETQDVYAAITYLPNSKVRIDAWAQIYSVRTNEVPGVSRVTQDFINNGNYIAGPASPVTSGPTAYFGYDIITFPNPPPFTFGSQPDGSYAAVNAATAHTVKLPNYVSLINPLDTARSFAAMGQMVTTVALSPDSSIVDRLFVSTGHSNKVELLGYSEYVPKNDAFQNRFEYRNKFETGKLEHSLITGIDFKYNALTSYQDYQTEPVQWYDMTQPASTIITPGYPYQGGTWGGGLLVPGTKGYSAAAGNVANVQEKYTDTAFFIQDDIKLTKQLTLTPGYRIDHIWVNGKNPPFVQVGYYNSFFQYIPTAAPIYIPAGGSSAYYHGYDNTESINDQSFFTSLTYKPTETATLYLTYDHVDALLGSSNFGGIDALYLDQVLSTKSTLYEAGYKQSFFNNTLYFATAIFQQLKYGSQITGGKYPIKDNGIELEAVYQPNRSWTFNGNLTYQEATAEGVFFQTTGNYLDAFATTTSVDGKFGTGIGGPNFTLYYPPNGRMRAPGIPGFQANVFGVYNAPRFWTVGLGAQFYGKMYANMQDTLEIPAQVEVDGFVSYAINNWQFRLNVKNALNQRLLDPIDVSFAGNSLISVRPGATASFTVRLKF